MFVLFFYLIVIFKSVFLQTGVYLTFFKLPGACTLGGEGGRGDQSLRSIFRLILLAHCTLVNDIWNCSNCQDSRKFGSRLHRFWSTRRNRCQSGNFLQAGDFNYWPKFHWHGINTSHSDIGSGRRQFSSWVNNEWWNLLGVLERSGCDCREGRVWMRHPPKGNFSLLQSYRCDR